ncbi:isopenicillin N synthase family oxygenase [Luminiphilus sp.]|nr:isopenicillin N synthase family oxygenase [Luminiphilus sp.]
MTSSSSIPLIDLKDSDDTVLPVLERALTEIGFVMVQGHSVPEHLVRTMRQQLETYFSRPLSEKLADCITPDNYRGYIPLGFFSPNSHGASRDQYEGYKLHNETAPDDPICSVCDLYGPNRWPPMPAQLQETTQAYWEACETTSRHLLRLIAKILDVEVDTFLSLFDQPLTNMTLLHYPPQNEGDTGFGIHAHKDTDALTLLFPDDVGGLWLRPHDDSEWLEVRAPYHSMVVNIGDLLELWSGGHFVSTPHKVVNTSGKERYSFPFFVVPRHDVVVSPLIACQPGFQRQPVPVGTVSREVWRTNWPNAVADETGFDLGTLADHSVDCSRDR